MPELIHGPRLTLSPGSSVFKLQRVSSGVTISHRKRGGGMIRKHFWYRTGTISFLMAALAATAAAQRNRNWDGYPNWGGSFDLRQTALNAGFNEGSKEGRNDRSSNRYRNYNDFSAYRDATKDYNSRLGNRDLYRRYFQTAFEHGYDAENPNGYNNNDNRDRNRNRDYDRDRDRNDNCDRERDRDRDRDRIDKRRGRNLARYGLYGR